MIIKFLILASLLILIQVGLVVIRRDISRKEEFGYNITLILVLGFFFYLIKVIYTDEKQTYEYIVDMVNSTSKWSYFKGQLDQSNGTTQFIKDTICEDWEVKNDSMFFINLQTKFNSKYPNKHNCTASILRNLNSGRITNQQEQQRIHKEILAQNKIDSLNKLADILQNKIDSLNKLESKPKMDIN